MASWKDWKGRVVRPIFRNLEVGPINGDYRKQFDITSPFLSLLNPRLRDGTLHVAGNMNNLYSFDNLIAMGGTRYRTTGLGTNTITEYIEEAEQESRDANGDKELAYRLIARRVSKLERASPAVWQITEELFDIDSFGENILVQFREVTYMQSGTQWEAVVK